MHTHISYSYYSTLIFRLSKLIKNLLLVKLLLTQVLVLFNQYKLITGQMRNSGKALLGLVLKHDKTRNSFPCSPLEPRGWRGEQGPLNGWKLGQIHGLDWRGSLGGLLTPLAAPCVGIMCRTHFTPQISEVPVGFLVFLYLIVHNLLQLCMQLFLVPHSFICNLLLKEIFI